MPSGCQSTSCTSFALFRLPGPPSGRQRPRGSGARRRAARQPAAEARLLINRSMRKGKTEIFNPDAIMKTCAAGGRRAPVTGICQRRKHRADLGPPVGGPLKAGPRTSVRSPVPAGRQPRAPTVDLGNPSRPPRPRVRAPSAGVAARRGPSRPARPLSGRLPVLQTGSGPAAAAPVVRRTPAPSGSKIVHHFHPHAVNYHKWGIRRVDLREEARGRTGDMRTHGVTQWPHQVSPTICCCTAV